MLLLLGCYTIKSSDSGAGIALQGFRDGQVCIILLCPILGLWSYLFMSNVADHERNQNPIGD